MYDNLVLDEIKKLKTNEEIRNFVYNRIMYLDKNESWGFIGRAYSHSYDGYIGSKTYFNSYDYSSEPHNKASVRLDDFTPYVELVKYICRLSEEQTSDPDEFGLHIFAGIARILQDYFSKKSSNLQRDRGIVYVDHHSARGIEPISIIDIREYGVASSYEINALAHNLYKFLNMPTKYSIGKDGFSGRTKAFLLYGEGRYSFDLFVMDFADLVPVKTMDNEVYGFPFVRGISWEERRNLFGSSGVLLKYDETYNIAAGILNKRCKLAAGLRIYKAGLDREIEPSTARRI